MLQVFDQHIVYPVKPVWWFLVELSLERIFHNEQESNQAREPIEWRVDDLPHSQIHNWTFLHSHHLWVSTQMRPNFRRLKCQWNDKFSNGRRSYVYWKLVCRTNRFFCILHERLGGIVLLHNGLRDVFAGKQTRHFESTGVHESANGNQRWEK